MQQWELVYFSFILLLSFLLPSRVSTFLLLRNAQVHLIFITNLATFLSRFLIRIIDTPLELSVSRDLCF